MRIHLIAVGQRMPKWVDSGFAQFAKRLPAHVPLKLVAVAAGKRGRNADIDRLMRQEGDRMLAALPADAHVIALHVQGRVLTSEQWSQQLAGWMQQGRDVALLIGGPEGLAPQCLQRADERWSLSALTLPHPLVRLVVVEQLYRASTILQGHPYHR